MKMFTILADIARCLLSAKTKRRYACLNKRSVLQINGTDQYTNARLSFEEDLVISYENDDKKTSVAYYPWEKISTMAYV